MARYCQNVLGYKESRKHSSPHIRTAVRIAVIYDHLVHRKPIKQMIQEYGVNYSTIRHILAQYYLFGRVQVRQFKYKGSFDNDFRRSIFESPSGNL